MAKILGHIICHSCHQKVCVSKYGKIFNHYRPSNGYYCPQCETSGKTIQNMKEVGKRPSKIPYGVYV